MEKILLLMFIIFGFTLQLSAQDRNCAAHDKHLQMLETNSDYAKNQQIIEKATERFINNPEKVNGEIITIPVVVHVVYKTNTQNISDDQIFSQIEILNEDFRRNNSDATNQWAQAADTEIEFCLATVDPDGNPTDGIQRRQTNKPSFSSNDFMKFNNKGGLDAWPAGEYMNFWVCNLGSGLLGYAQFPGGPANTDGVVVDYAYFGDIGTATSPYDLGRTATHEVGHWLNLRHIWGDGGCSVDDFVSDTPLSDASNGGCATGHVSCGTVDMVENYMDYSYDACMNLFTNGQSTRMNALFAPGGARESLLTSGGCGTSSGPTCNDGIQNGNETGVDCGGPDCDPCSVDPTCDDGIQNGNETGVDCGGPDCDPCTVDPTCNDGVQNGGETGIDCGGPDCDPCSSGGCDAPSGLFANKIKPKSAQLNWSAVAGATSYTIQIAQAGQTNWSTFTTSNTNITISGLTKNQSYDWNVTATCSSGDSDESATCNFTAGQSNTGDCAARLAYQIEDISVFPNPTAGQLFISGISNEYISQISIFDTTGKRSTSLNNFDSTQGISTDNLQQGVYYMRIILEDGSSTSVRFIVIK